MKIFFILGLATALADFSYAMESPEQKAFNDLMEQFKASSQKTWGLRVPNDKDCNEIEKSVKEHLNTYSFPGILNQNKTYQDFLKDTTRIYKNILLMPSELTASLEQEKQFVKYFVALYTMAEPFFKKGLLDLDNFAINKKDKLNETQLSLRKNIAKLFWLILKGGSEHEVDWRYGFTNNNGEKLLLGEQLLSLNWPFFKKNKEIESAVCQFLRHKDGAFLENDIGLKKSKYEKKYGYTARLLRHFFEVIDKARYTESQKKQAKEYMKKHGHYDINNPILQIKLFFRKMLDLQEYANDDAYNKLAQQIALKKFTLEGRIFTVETSGDYWNNFHKEKSSEEIIQIKKEYNKTNVYIVDEFKKNHEDKQSMDPVKKEVQEKKEKLFGNIMHGEAVKYVHEEYSDHLIPEHFFLNAETVGEVIKTIKYINSKIKESKKPTILSLSMTFPFNQNLIKELNEFFSYKDTVLVWSIPNKGGFLIDSFNEPATYKYMEALFKLSIQDRILLVLNAAPCYEGKMIYLKNNQEDALLKAAEGGYFVEVTQPIISQTLGGHKDNPLHDFIQKNSIAASGNTYVRYKDYPERSFDGTSSATGKVSGALGRAVEEQGISPQKAIELIKTSANKNTRILSLKDIHEDSEGTKIHDPSKNGFGTLDYEKFMFFTKNIDKVDTILKEQLAVEEKVYTARKPYDIPVSFNGFNEEKVEILENLYIQELEENKTKRQLKKQQEIDDLLERINTQKEYSIEEFDLFHTPSQNNLQKIQETIGKEYRRLSSKQSTLAQKVFAYLSREEQEFHNYINDVINAIKNGWSIYSPVKPFFQDKIDDLLLHHKKRPLYQQEMLKPYRINLILLSLKDDAKKRGDKKSSYLGSLSEEDWIYIQKKYNGTQEKFNNILEIERTKGYEDDLQYAKNEWRYVNGTQKWCIGSDKLWEIEKLFENIEGISEELLKQRDDFIKKIYTGNMQKKESKSVCAILASVPEEYKHELKAYYINLQKTEENMEDKYQIVKQILGQFNTKQSNQEESEYEFVFEK